MPAPSELQLEESLLVGVDTGGTFTDVVVWDGCHTVHGKVLSTPEDPSRAIIEALSRMGLKGKTLQLIHGTTVGTNAVLEGKGVRVAYLTSRGFADVLTLARQNRKDVYALEQPVSAPPVPTSLCFEVSSRPDAHGQLLSRATDEELRALGETIKASGVEAVAVNLLFAFLCADEEQRISEFMPEGTFCSLASEVLPELREYERGIATWLNASVGPLMARYLNRLSQALGQAKISVMQSAGTTIAAEHAAEQSVRLLLSGPAGGIAAARLLGETIGKPRLMTLDMGGTSTDVSLLDGAIPLTNRSEIAGWPLTIPTVDIHTIGAGGGSIAQVDEGGLLLVGPESAGAVPGPACYGQGGSRVTVTDANVLLGRLPPDTLLGGYLPLDTDAAEKALERLGEALGCGAVEAASGVLRMANEHMARALRVMSVERGHDPRDYVLLCFGGAGGLHACAVAELLDMQQVVMPALGGVLSAQGMLASEPGRELSLAVLSPLADCNQEQLSHSFQNLEHQATDALVKDGVDPDGLVHQRHLELRYQGQSETIQLPWQALAHLEAAFHAAHESATGHRLNLPVELVNLRLSTRSSPALAVLPPLEPAGDRALSDTPGETVWLPDFEQDGGVWQREHLTREHRLHGPCIVVDKAATTWVAPGWQGKVDDWGNLVLDRQRP